MKYSTIAVAIAALAVGVIGQGLADIPPCPQKCILGGTAKTTCSLADIACSCKDLAYQAQLAECMAACDPAEAAKGAEVGAAICKQAGVEITIPSVTTEAPVVDSTTTSAASPPTDKAEEPVVDSTTTAAETTTTPEADGREETTSTPTLPAAPTTLVSVLPVATGNTTSNGTISRPVATATPPVQEDSAAGRMAVGSFLGVAVMGAIAFAL